jgi:hypothetical protein
MCHIGNLILNSTAAQTFSKESIYGGKVVYNKPFNKLHLYHLRNWNSLNSTLKKCTKTYMHQVFSVLALQQTVTLEEEK